MARQNPPIDAVATPNPRALNTGILCDNLRVLDFDIDDGAKCNDCLQIALQMWPGVPCRYRDNSARRLLLLRAAEGEPGKITLTGASHTTECGCKIEVLGKGHMFVAFGDHESGAKLQWTTPPGDVTLAELPAATEEEIQSFLARCAPIIGADKPPRTNGGDRKAGEPQANPQRLAPALAAIPNNARADWECWNIIGMAMWAATGGSESGLAMFDHWSARHPDYDPKATRERWDHYHTSPPSKIGAGTIFHLAAQHGWREPQPEDDPNYVALVDAQARQEERPSLRHATPEELTACTHVWRLHGANHPCRLTGVEDSHHGRVFVEVTRWDGAVGFAPKDDVIPKDQVAAVEAAEAAAKRAASQVPPAPDEPPGAPRQAPGHTQPPEPDTATEDDTETATPPSDNPSPQKTNGPEPPDDWGELQPPPCAEDDDFVLPVEFSENMLAYLFSEQHAETLVYVHGWGKWMRWENGRWREDHAVKVFDEARKICAREGERALRTLDPRTAKKVTAAINKASCIAAIERLARHHAPQTRAHQMFDANPGLLNGPSSSIRLKGA
jgi:hypothetical protein